MIKLIFLLLSISYVYSANWLMIQGTQKATTKDHNLWGFGQLKYTHNRGNIYEINGLNKNLANDMNIEVLAEGVETIEQEKFLIENGCSLAQGYLYDKALTVDEINKK